MSITTFFNRPTEQRCKHVARDRLCSDIAGAKSHAIIAAAWFTDKAIADALIESGAKIRRAIFNRSDLNRPDQKRENAPNIYATLQLSGVEVAILGTGDWKEGVMHHKFIVADDVVWTGSYNWTYQAQRNFENLVRIEIADIAKDFLREAMAIWDLADRDEADEPGYLDADGMFRRTKSWEEAWERIKAMHGSNKVETPEAERVVRRMAAEVLTAEYLRGDNFVMHAPEIECYRCGRSFYSASGFLSDSIGAICGDCGGIKNPAPLPEWVRSGISLNPKRKWATRSGK